MPVTFPLSTADFLELLPVASITMHLPEIVEISRTGGGEVLTEDLGPRLWQGTVELGKLLTREAEEAQTMIDLLRGAGRSFFAFDTRSPGPRLDLTGAILGAATPQIRALGSDARVMQLKGLPPGYQLVRGDRLSFDYSSNPTRTALHRIVDASVVANGAGETGDFEVMPEIRAGAAVDATVRLVRPQCKVVLVPGSVEAGSRRSHLSEGMSFQFIQTLR